MYATYVIIEGLVPRVQRIWQQEAIKASDLLVIHPADEHEKDTSQAHVLEQEQVKLVGIELGHAVAGSGSGRLQDTDCALIC